MLILLVLLAQNIFLAAFCLAEVASFFPFFRKKVTFLLFHGRRGRNVRTLDKGEAIDGFYSNKKKDSDRRFLYIKKR